MSDTSARFVFAALKITELPPGEKMVLLILADHADSDGFAYPSHKTIAMRAACSVSSVKVHLGHLTRKGYIQKANVRRGDGSQASNVYQLLYLGGGVASVDHWFSEQNRRGRAVKPWSDTASEPAPPANRRLPPSQILATPETPSKNNPVSVSREESMDPIVDSLLGVYNENRGSLPAMNKPIASTRRHLHRLVVEHGGLDEAMEVLRRATLVVSKNPYWQQKKYNLQNLMAKDNYYKHALAYVESYAAKAAEPEAPALHWSVGDTVTFEQTIGAGRVIQLTGVVRGILNEHQILVEYSDERYTGGEVREATVPYHRVVA